MPDSKSSGADLPESRAVVRSRTRISVVWVVPILAALMAIWVWVAKVRSEGPSITIVFDTAEGLEAGKTKVHYNGVDVGTLTTIRLSDDHRQVVATAEMAPRTEDFFVEDTRFWIVRARISGANVSGLGTLLSGAYIGMEIGTSKTRKRDFVALTAPPVVSGELPGRFFVLKTAELGSLDTGTPIYFRRLPVGEVTSYEMVPDGSSLNVKVFVNAPYDRFVTPETRFWHASGIDMSLSAEGLSVQTQSVLSLLVGGVAFETPPSSASPESAEANTVFTLFKDQSQAFKPPRGDPQTYAIVLKQSVRGLTRGAPVEFRGVPIGEVVDMRSQFDERTYEFSVLVTVHVYPEMLGAGVQPVDLQTSAGAALRRERLDALTARGLRAQLQTGSMLTGSLYVALDFFPDAAPATIDWSADPPRVPTTPGELEAIEATLVRIVNKLDKLPLDTIGTDVTKSLDELKLTLVSARRTLDDAGKVVAPNSALQADLGTTLQDISRAAQSLREVLDYLDRHPEALLRGKKGEAKP
jgi:paraquat-inducible protein B